MATKPLFIIMPSLYSVDYSPSLTQRASPQCFVPSAKRRPGEIHSSSERIPENKTIMDAAAKPVIKVAAIGGSLRKGSFNRSLLRAAEEICKESIEGMEIEYVDISNLPFMNTDLEGFGDDKSKFAARIFPDAVETFRSKVRAADSILFASPEYNYSVTAPLKNALDWGSRPKKDIWTGKAAAIISAGGAWGGGRSHYHLRQIGVYLDLHFINKPELFVYAHQPPAKFSSDGKLIDEDTRKRLKDVLLALQAFTLRLKGYN